MNEVEERSRGYDLEIATLAANVRRDNAEAQVKRLGDVMAGLEAELADAYRKLEGAEAQAADGKRFRSALAKIVAAFTSGVYCANCGAYVTDCDCIINVGYRALYPPIASGG